MEELFLGLLLAGNELNVIHQEQIGLTILFPHLCGFAFANGVNQLVGQVITLDVGDF